ncbi:MAG TPA: hypothetical protein EYP59_03090, partial [Thiotrichaceae bacterium]|nr:hypothetical protein [Thiotrichaceae bacterium]
FIESVKESLNLNEVDKRGKKKSIKRLLEKLIARKEILDKAPKKALDKKEKKALKEEQAIINLQIKKAEKILSKFSTEDQKISKNKKEK